MPRPPVKKTYKVEKARIKAQLDAKDEHDAKAFSFKGQKRLKASIFTHIGKAIDRVDPLETGAVLAVAYLVYENIPAWLETLLGIRKDEVLNEVARVSASFATAYILVHHAGAIIGGAASILTGALDVFKWVIISKGLGAATGTASAAFWTVPSVIPWVTLMPQLKPEWFHDGKIGVPLR